MLLLLAVIRRAEWPPSTMRKYVTMRLLESYLPSREVSKNINAPELSQSTIGSKPV